MPVARHFAFFGTCGRVDDLEFFARVDVIALVGHHADRRAPRALLGLFHEQLQLLFFTFPKFALGNELVAGIPLVFAGVGEDRERTFDRRRARRQEYGTIIAINGALRRTRSLASFKRTTAKIRTGQKA